MSGRLFPLSLLVLMAGTSACSSIPAPTYRDYEVRVEPTPSDSALTARLRRAAEAAGWMLAPQQTPGIVTTASRPVPGGTFGRTTAELDLVPLNAGVSHGPRFVRVVVRAERRSALGGRAKVYALDGRLRDELLGPISDALASQGLVALGTPRDRDEDAADD
jgi:hypothetical protein